MKNFKKNFFLKLFAIPYLIWFVLTILAVHETKLDPDPVTWEDFIIANVFVFIVWFIISYLISNIFYNKKKKTSSKTMQSESRTDSKLVVKSKETKKITKKKESHAENCLYTCESIISGYEYKKMAKYFPKRIYWKFIQGLTFVNLFVTAIIALFTKSWLVTLIFFILCQIFTMLLYYFKRAYFAEMLFNTRAIRNYNLEKGTTEIEIKTETEFYETYFIRKDEKTSLKIDYSEISKCVENDTNFYFEYPQRNLVFIFQKNRCSLELINFIRKTFKNIENHLGDTAKFKGAKNYHNPTFIRIGMLILFIITIASFWSATLTFLFFNKLHIYHGFNFVKNAWIFLFWLPIPILSIILGFKYKHAGFKCKKNIVGGFIIGFLLLAYGSFYMFPTFSRNYSEIEAYKNIIDAKLPDNGELEIQDWGTFIGDDKTEYIIINAYYEREDVSNLTDSIEKNNHWILSEAIDPELQMLIPSTLYQDKDAYFSIFNNTTKEYNTLPNETGNYEIFAMKYDESEKHLEIHKFTYAYQK